MGIRIVRNTGRMLSEDTAAALHASIIEFEAKRWSEKCSGDALELHKKFIEKVADVRQSIKSAQDAAEFADQLSERLNEPKKTSLHTFERVGDQILLDLL